MIFQYPASPQSHVANILFWIMIIIAAVFAFFLLVEYMNTHQIHHLLWAGAFIATWIVFHQVALFGTYGVTTDTVGAGLSLFMTGSIAAGLLYAVFGREKKVLGRISIGHLYIILVICMSIITTLMEFSRIRSYWFEPDLEVWAKDIVVSIFYLVNAIVIVGLPIYTTFKTKETSRAALLMSAGGVLWSFVGIFWLLILTIGGAVELVVVALMVYFMVIGTICYAFGMLYEKKWSFRIPGIEFED
ncbi:MAG: hypothetical protein ACW972_04040 [Promethearchaeota archaeon]|jgi:hypothetical protein